MRRETRASHALAVLIEVDDGPDRIDFGASIHLAIAAEEGVDSRRSRIYGGRDWVRLGAVELGLPSRNGSCDAWSHRDPVLQSRPGAWSRSKGLYHRTTARDPRRRPPC